VQDNDNSVQDVTIVSSVSKAGGRLVIGVPKKFEGEVRELFGKPVRVTLELLV